MRERSTARRLVRNVVSMTAFQASGYILAMLNVPYLTRTLGVADYGVLSFTISINAYLWLLMDWGFSLGATRDIARALGDADRIRQVFWRTMTAKALLATVALAGLVAVAALDKVPSAFFIVFLPGAINIVSAILTVDWLMLGLEQMGLFSAYSIAGRALVVGLTFVLVHGPGDTWIACCLQTFGSLASSAAGFLIVRRFFKMGLPIIDLRAAVGQIWDYRHYFLTQSSAIAYSTAAPLLLAVVSGSVAVGLFAGAERIARIAMSLIFPLSTALYPHVNARITESRAAAAEVAGLVLAAQILFGVALLVVFTLGAHPIVALVLGNRFGPSVDVLRWLAVLPLLTGVSSTLSSQFLIPLGRRREGSQVTVAGTCVYLILLALLGRHFGALGAAMALISTEALIVAGLTMRLLRHEELFARMACHAALRMPSRLYKQQANLLQRYRARVPQGQLPG